MKRECHQGRESNGHGVFVFVALAVAVWFYKQVKDHHQIAAICVVHAVQYVY